MTTEKRRQTLSDWKKLFASGDPAPVREVPAEPSEVMRVLTGDLSEKSMGWLLMAAKYYDVTGRMYVGSSACNVTLQFGLGAPVHAYSPFCSGAEAIMDLFIWKDGRVRFEPGQPPDSASIQETVDELVARGERFVEDLEFLTQNSISELSFLLRPQTRITEAELRQKLSFGRPIDLNLQCSFFGNVYGTLNLKDVAEKLHLTQSQWVAIATNLLKLGVLIAPNASSLKDPKMEEQPGFNAIPQTVPSPAPSGAPTPFEPAFEIRAADATHTMRNPFLEPQTEKLFIEPETVQAPSAAGAIQLGVPTSLVSVDPARSERVWNLLRTPDTGVLTIDSMQFFLEREFARAYRFRSIMSLILFCVKLTATTDNYVSAQDCSTLTNALSKIKRDVDFLGHFGPSTFALLLPSVDSAQASVLVERISIELPPLAPDLNAYKPTLHFGVASVPEDCTDLNQLIQSAQRAMLDAAKLNVLKVVVSQTRLKGTTNT